MGAEVFRYQDLRAAGWSRGHIESAVGAQRLVRVRKGWFAVAGANRDQVLAVRARGAVTCVSALRQHRVWVPPAAGGPHVRLGRGGRPCPDLVVCCSSSRHAAESALDPVGRALEAALRCRPPDMGVAMLDSALNQGHVTPAEAEALVLTMPDRRQRVLARYDGRSQSGTESVVRVRLALRGISVRPQVRIEGVGWVDLLVGDRLVIECDSRAHHTGVDTYSNDRRRDRVLVTRGYLVLRLTYEDVMHRWATVVEDVLAVVRADRHRWRTGRGA